MPCEPHLGIPLGACCQPIGLNIELPFLRCGSCWSEERCIGQDCTDIVRQWMVDNPGIPWDSFAPSTGIPNDLSKFTTTVDRIWHSGDDCADLREATGGIAACGGAGACCFEACAGRPGTEGCWPVIESACMRGYTVGITPVWTPRLPTGTTRIADNCRYKVPLNNLCPPHPGVHRQNFVCRCAFSYPPYVAQSAIALGFTGCVMESAEDRTWEEACLSPFDEEDEEFPCQTLGMPLVFDGEGFAVFDAGDRRISPDPNECVHVIADMHLDSDGFARALACREFDSEGNATEIAIATMHQELCAVMYGDYTWDEFQPC